MLYRLLFRDPVSRAALDEQELHHCGDERTALRWLAAQLSELEVELWTGPTMLAARSALGGSEAC